MQPLGERVAEPVGCRRRERLLPLKRKKVTDLDKLKELRHMKEVLWDLQDDLNTTCDIFDGECSICPKIKLCNAINNALDNVKKLYNMEVNTDEE